MQELTLDIASQIVDIFHPTSVSEVTQIIAGKGVELYGCVSEIA